MAHSNAVSTHRCAVRLVGVGVSGFGERYEQLPLWEDDEEQVPHHPSS